MAQITRREMLGKVGKGLAAIVGASALGKVLGGCVYQDYGNGYPQSSENPIESRRLPDYFTCDRVNCNQDGSLSESTLEKYEFLLEGSREAVTKATLVYTDVTAVARLRGQKGRKITGEMKIIEGLEGKKVNLSDVENTPFIQFYKFNCPEIQIGTNSEAVKFTGHPASAGLWEVKWFSDGREIGRSQFRVIGPRG